MATTSHRVAEEEDGAGRTDLGANVAKLKTFGMVDLVGSKLMELPSSVAR